MDPQSRRGMAIHRFRTSFETGGGVGRTVVVSLILAAASCSPRPQVVEADLAIVGVDLIPMTSDSVVHGQSVFVSDGRIVRIADSASVRSAPGVRVIDGRGRFLFPGLVDAHAHVRVEKALDLFLSYGITTLRNMHGGLGDPLTWAREIEAGRLRGPTLINASPLLRWDTEGLTLPGPEPLRSIEDVKRAVEAARDSGYAVIKVLQFPREPFDSLMSAATALGVPVAGHLPMMGTGDPRVDMTLDDVLGSGMSVIEHVGELIEKGISPAQRDSVAVEDLARRVAASGVAVSTITDLTLLVTAGLTQGDAFPSDSIRAQILKYGDPSELGMIDRLPDIWRQMVQAPIEREYLSLFIRRLHRAGVPLLVGTDAHSPLQVGGLSAIQDMLYLVESGLTPYDALAAMTVVPARVLGDEGVWGTVVEGGRADALLLSENPLSDPAVLLSAIEGVVLRGQWIDRAELDALRSDAESRVLFCRAPRCDG